MENNQFITRQFQAQFRACEDAKNKIIGRPIVFEQKTDLGFCEEIIESGALDKTDLRDVLFFVNHDTSKIPLARSRNNNENSTMRMVVDDEGLLVHLTLDIENNAEARSLYSAISRQDITGMSFMFKVNKQEWDDIESEKPIRKIKEISKVVEVSAVNFPVYKQTSITARDKSALDSVRRSLENAREQVLMENNTSLELEKLKINMLRRF